MPTDTWRFVGGGSYRLALRRGIREKPMDVVATTVASAATVATGWAGGLLDARRERVGKVTQLSCCTG